MVKYWERIKPLMDKMGIGKQGLADALGVSFQAVAKVENGGQFGTLNNSKAAKFFNVSPDWLATGKGDASPSSEKSANLGLTDEESKLLNAFRLLDEATKPLILSLVLANTHSEKNLPSHPLPKKSRKSA